VRKPPLGTGTKASICSAGAAVHARSEASPPIPIESLPRCLYLEITDKCNMNCPMCITRAYRQPRTDPLLSRREIREMLLDPVSAWGGRHFVVSGGEPMLSPILEDVLHDAVGRDLDITFATNILDEPLHKFDDVLRVIDDPRHGFQFSFDSVDPLEMNHIRGKDVHASVVANARKIADLRDRYGYRARLFAQIVLQELNVGSVFKTIEFLLKEIGVDVCIVQPEVKYSDVTVETLKRQRPIEYSPESRSNLLDTVRRLFALASSDKRIRVEGGSSANWEKFLTAPLTIEGPCNSRNMVMVGPYGDLRGCLFSPIIGNIREAGLLDYLQSPEYRESLDLARVCKICINGCA
jgi:MoaA/NifB/PqqE/SkfB family radical SAM enzyme